MRLPDVLSRIVPALRSRALAVDIALWTFLVAPVLLAAPGLTGDATPWIKALLITVGVAARRRVPLLSLMAVTALCLPYVVQSPASDSWPFIAIVVLSYLAGRRMAQGVPALTGFAVIALVGLALSVTHDGVWTWLSLLMIELLAVGAWWAGRFNRLRRQLARAGWEHAERLEREHLMVAEQARLRERARIAGDMHDFLGHELSLLALQAGALELAPDLDEKHRATAARLRAGAGTAIDLLNDTIGLLREASEPALLAPTSESIADLVAGVAKSGVPVSLVTDGTAREFPLMAERAAYRVVQESLTNAIKYAPGCAITVQLDHDHGGLTVTVTNKLRSPEAQPVEGSGSGSGLIGLHERVRLAGGTLEAGPKDGVFSVRARFPRESDPEQATGVDAALEAPSAKNQRETRQRQVRRQLMLTAVLPIALVVGLAATLVSMRVYTVSTTALAAASFEQLTIGQSRTDVAHLLPESSLAKPPPVVVEPAPPAGTTCAYYQAGGDLLNLSNDLYRLCFRGEELVAKDRLDG